MANATAAAADPLLNAPVVPIHWVKTLELNYADADAFAAGRPPPVCFSCGKEQLAQQLLLKCAKCKVAAYCSKECQVADWKKKHKLACASYARVGADTMITS